MNSPTHQLIQQKLITLYLPFSYRAIVYVSLAFFSRIIRSILIASFPQIGVVIFTISNILIFEIILRLVKKYYRPNFNQAGDLDPDAYQFRTSQEIYLFSTFAYFLVNFVTSTIICLITKSFATEYILATLGSVAFIFSFFGFVLLVAKIQSNGSGGPELYARTMGLLFHLVGWVYVYFGLSNLSLNLSHLLFLF